MGQIVFEALLDEAWNVKVTRTADYNGELTITPVGETDPVYRREVTLSYNAAFGPDISDVYEWQDIAANWVDDLSKDAQ